MLFFPVWVFFQSGESSYSSEFKKIEHEITVAHPGNEDNGLEQSTLVEVRNKKGMAVEFYMNVESVICVKSVCKVVPVRIFWNNLGEYQKYELDKGVTLEKYEADLFEKQDYVKLHSILSNLDSPFKNVRIDEILTVADETHNDVDAVSGATALELDEEDTVPGAALTCFTLWHWAHGDIETIIRNFTGKSLKKQVFKNYLTSIKENEQLFAIEQLLETKNYKKNLVDAVINETSKNDNLLRSTFKYINNASDKKYFQAIEKLFLKGNEKQKIIALNSLLNSKRSVSSKYLDGLSKEVLSLKTYQEISIFLRLMKAKNSNSQEVIKHTIPLLDKDLLIARSVYWFLKDKNLSDKQQKKLAVFYSKNKNQL
ncbi:hypothetical protein SAMN05444411_101451 [Lutibacter oricola]|uniref:Uncharacterized protein n=1 Tax=Lutibacter oricola TaxID=762486 RepID=A0A1H2SHJ6_9FLAO|nr:hypothetical protein SAMN05444411_101451 [Lutibacter oricola]